MTGWDDPNSNPMADMQRAIEQDGYPFPPTHPKGQHGLEQNKRLLPLELAVKQVAEETGVPEHQIRQYAEQMRRRTTSASVAAGIMTGPFLKAAVDFELAAQKIAAVMDRPAAEVRAKLLEMAKTSTRPAEDQCPRNAADRRTFHLAGKPYHYTQDSSGKLHTEPGESPWT